MSGMVARDRQREDARRWFDRLAPFSVGRIEMLMKNRRGWSSLGWVDELCARSRAEARTGGSDCLRWAALAVFFAAEVPEPDLAEANALASAELCNAFRVSEDFTSADKAMTEAKRWVRRAPDSNSLRAELLSLEASLRRDRRQVPELLRALEEAEELAATAEDRSIGVRLSIQLGWAEFYFGDAGSALAAFEKAAFRWRSARRGAAPREKKYMFQVITQGLCMADAALGNKGRALEHLTYLEYPLSNGREEKVLGKTKWARGLVMQELGDLPEAEEALVEASEIFERLGLARSHALSLLDDAAVALACGRIDRVLTQCSALVPLLSAMGYQEEVLVADRLHRSAGAAVAIYAAGLEQIKLKVQGAPLGSIPAPVSPHPAGSPHD